MGCEGVSAVMKAEVVNVNLFHGIAKLFSVIKKKLGELGIILHREAVLLPLEREDITFLEPSRKNFQSLTNGVIHPPEWDSSSLLVLAGD